MKAKPFVAVVFVLFSACSAMQQSYVEQTCQSESAYAQGMNQARAGKPMEESFAYLCPAESKTLVMASYRKGYTSGLQSMQPEAPSSLITVNIPGAAERHRAWHCKLSVFMKDYSAFGRTELEAREKVASSCEAEYHPMHCDQISCERNL